MLERGLHLPRRERSPDQEFTLALERVQTLLGTPVEEVGLKLREFLLQALRSFQGNELTTESFKAASVRVAEIVGKLPRSFGDRFYFDSALIRGIGEDWTTNCLASAGTGEGVLPLR